jgi:hypothetical protein
MNISIIGNKYKLFDFENCKQHINIVNATDANIIIIQTDENLENILNKINNTIPIILLIDYKNTKLNIKELNKAKIKKNISFMIFDKYFMVTKSIFNKTIEQFLRFAHYEMITDTKKMDIITIDDLIDIIKIYDMIKNMTNNKNKLIRNIFL